MDSTSWGRYSIIIRGRSRGGGVLQHDLVDPRVQNGTVVASCLNSVTRKARLQVANVLFREIQGLNDGCPFHFIGKKGA